MTDRSDGPAKGPENRSNARKDVGLLVKLSYSGVDEFAQRYATNLSDGGMFIRTREPKAVGSQFRFKVEIANGQRVLQGNAVVRWVRGANDPNGPAGMGVQFLDLDPASKALVDKMLASATEKRPPVVAPVQPAQKPPAIAPTHAAPNLNAAVAPPTIAPPTIAPPTIAPPSIAPPTIAPPTIAPPTIAPPSIAPPSIAPPSIAPARPPPPPVQAKPVAPPAPAKPPPPPPPPPVEDAPLFELDLDPPPAGENEVELDLDTLLATTPPAPPEAPINPTQSAPGLIESTPSSFEIDVEFDLPPPPPSAPPPPPAPQPLPEVRREAVKTEAPVVPRQVLAAQPAAAPQVSAGPIFLTSTEPIADTGPVIGIDLGTTNSACAVVGKGRPQILRSKDGYNTIPSVVALTKHGKLEVGHRAKGQMVLNPKQSVFGAKRLVGRDFESPTVKHVRERSHYEIVADTENRAAVRLGQYTLTLEEVQGLILKECREMAEVTLGTKVSRAVVTCPAYYSEPQREAVRRAGKLAGLKVERVLNEPTAAALAFGMNRELAKTVLVYDLGGGTFDATLLKIDKNVFEVQATGGDVFLGGVDFDNQIVDLLLQRFQNQHGRPFAGDQVALSRIAEVAEKAKIALSEQSVFEVHLPMLEMDPSGTPKDLRCALTRADVERVCTSLIDRTIQAVQDVLLDAKLKPSQVDDVILVGGMSRMPAVREKLKAVMGKAPQASVNADEAVALGAALYSGSVDKVSSLVLIDVVPMTVGVGKPGGAFHRLIERNTPLPATKSFGISTTEDDQRELEVLIFQGEDGNVAGNEFLGALKLTGLPKGAKGAVQVAITISLDAECVLKAEAREFKTRNVVQATLATRYTSDDVAKRLGISAEKRAQSEQKRAEELGQRSGGFWGKLKGLFSRK